MKIKYLESKTLAVLLNLINNFFETNDIKIDKIDIRYRCFVYECAIYYKLNN